MRFFWAAFRATLSVDLRSASIESNGYGASRLALNALSGQSVRFRFRIASDTGIPDYGWFIDDVRIYSCQPFAPTTRVYLPFVRK